MPHLDGEEVMAIPLSLFTRGVLCEEDFDELQEIVERAWW